MAPFPPLQIAFFVGFIVLSFIVAEIEVRYEARQRELYPHRFGVPFRSRILRRRSRL